MKKFILTLASLLAFNSQAAVISVELADSEIAVGESTTVTVTGAFDSTTEAFDFASLSVFFDNSQLIVDESSFASDLPYDFGINQELFMFDNVGFNEVILSWLDYTGTTFSSIDAFTLLSFDVIGSSTGNYEVSLAGGLDPDYLLFTNGIDEITDITTNNATLNVTEAAEVAAPHTALLFSLMLGGMMVARRRA
ncbi:hypothetical protein [Alteromonas lipolytica]|uniref:PEP-CTERM protein-sorting domain-containing protein n=1 Tax=Alteromonas lipolytica TaxID=1856405 RepID=A0A1E8FA14_9ALTE|nr:hypothetical protein [Alteromonas lipolytica]OFI32764.1 hypothetical protein BFC17_06330 [Alteromonas lipolytica]GGF73270.1 hypothetical protein GCM10011338_26780 [Alteromonas lipolytica]